MCLSFPATFLAYCRVSKVLFKLSKSLKAYRAAALKGFTILIYMIENRYLISKTTHGRNNPCHLSHFTCLIFAWWFVLHVEFKWNMYGIRWCSSTPLLHCWTVYFDVLNNAVLGIRWAVNWRYYRICYQSCYEIQFQRCNVLSGTCSTDDRKRLADFWWWVALWNGRHERLPIISQKAFYFALTHTLFFSISNWTLVQPSRVA